LKNTKRIAKTQIVSLLQGDFASGFDTVNRKLIYYILDKMNAEPFAKAVKISLENSYTQVYYNGEMGPRFPLERGVKQGSNISPICFAIITEALRLLMKDTLDPKYYFVNFDCTFMMYCDYLTIILSDPRGILQILEALIKFEVISGVKINPDKSSISCFGTARQIHKAKTYLTQEITKGICIQENKAEILGVKIEDTIKKTAEVNWNRKLQKVELTIPQWDRYSLSWSGKIRVAQNILQAQFTFFMKSMVIDPAWFNKVNICCKSFVFKNYRFINSDRFEIHPSKGGMGLPKIDRIYAGIKIRALIEIAESSEWDTPSWMRTTKNYCDKYGGLLYLMLKNIDVEGLPEGLDEWTKDALKYWIKYKEDCLPGITIHGIILNKKYKIDHKMLWNKEIATYENEYILKAKNFPKSKLDYILGKLEPCFIRSAVFKKALLEEEPTQNIGTTIKLKKGKLIHIDSLEKIQEAGKKYKSNWRNHLGKNDSILKPAEKLHSLGILDSDKYKDEYSCFIALNHKLNIPKKIKEINLKYVWNLIPTCTNLEKWKIRIGNICDVCDTAVPQDLIHYASSCPKINKIWDRMECAFETVHGIEFDTKITNIDKRRILGTPWEFEKGETRVEWFVVSSLIRAHIYFTISSGKTPSIYSLFNTFSSGDAFYQNSIV